MAPFGTIRPDAEPQTGHSESRVIARLTLARLEPARSDAAPAAVEHRPRTTPTPPARPRRPGFRRRSRRRDPRGTQENGRTTSTPIEPDSGDTHCSLRQMRPVSGSSQ